MIINSSAITMGSSRKSNTVYEKETLEIRQPKNASNKTMAYKKDSFTISEESRDLLMNYQNKTSHAKNNNIKSKDENETSKEYINDENSSEEPSSGISLNTSASQGFIPEIDDIYTIKLKAALLILESILSSQKTSGFFKDFFKDSKFSKNLRKLKNDNIHLFDKTGIKSITNSSSQGTNSQVWKIERQESHFFKEEETTVFSSTGLVKTADGRNISFNVDVEMSRNFEQYLKEYTSEEVIFTDPLIINLNSNPTSVSSQRFLFDIDGDGKEEEISMLGKGSGFLAFDKNGDGIINDGSELFGTVSGNGFKDLSKYDDDNNGWIDEADTIFSQLRVWTKDDSGNDVLLSLKEADIGAIYLGNTSTEFSLKDSETNEHNAQIRATGIYIKESGGTGTIQQVDMVSKN